MRAVRKRDIAVLLIMLAIIGLAIGRWWMDGTGDVTDSDAISIDANAGGQRVLLPEIGPQEYKPLSETEAFLENAQLPFSTEPVEEARPYAMPDTPDMPFARRSAVECLTAAIYYEAGFEPASGKRAVAQVVLNRARHPAFPNSVCAVIYQGSQRSTGCQFTFTCDGSLSRAPVPRAWEAARQIAQEALSGRVEPSVGMATHYHADYVVPYWAPSLSKIVKHGSHYFYRWKGGWGRRGAFTQAVIPDTLDPGSPQFGDAAQSELEALINAPATEELAPPSNIFADERAGELVPRDLAPTTAIRPTSAPTPQSPAIQADRGAGTLIVDENIGQLRE